MSYTGDMTVTSLPGPVTFWLPFLEGWRMEVLCKWWWELKCNPIRRGEAKLVLEIKPENADALYLLGMWTAVTSRRLMLVAVQPSARGGERCIFGAWPELLFSYGHISWTSYGAFCTVYDTGENFYAMSLIPVSPIPARADRPIRLYSVLGFPKAWPAWGSIVPQVPDIRTGTWVDVTDSEAEVRHVGALLLVIEDAEAFLRSLRRLIEDINIKVKRL